MPYVNGQYFPEEATGTDGATASKRGIVEQDLTNQFNTPLTPQEQADYNTKFSPEDSYDYDMQGWYKANPVADPKAEGVHYPDTFKKPNHMTFSNQSQYSNNQTMGGVWSDGENPSFTPSAYNLTQHDSQTLKDYFSKVEPNSQLILPDEDRSVVDKLLGNNGPRYQTWPERAIRGAISSLALPGDVLSGKVQPNSPQEIERAVDLAGLMVGGPAPVAAKMADGTLGSFAGVKSKMLDKNALAEAQVLTANGVHPTEVYQKTGFFKGADSRWRFEIPDNNAQLKMDNFVSEGGSIRPKNPLNDVDMTKMSTLEQINHLADAEVHQPLSEIIDHPELFKAYPFLKDVRVQNMPDSMKSKALAFVDSNGTIQMSPMSPDMTKQVLLHEVQHLIQRHEGFAKGGNAKSFESPNLPKAQKIYDDAIANGADPNSPNMVKAKKIIDDNRAQAYQSYLRLAGEVESRNVEARLLLNDIQRKRISPQSTEDHARNEQIVRFYNE